MCLLRLRSASNRAICDTEYTGPSDTERVPSCTHAFPTHPTYGPYGPPAEGRAKPTSTKRPSFTLLVYRLDSLRASAVAQLPTERYVPRVTLCVRAISSDGRLSFIRSACDSGFPGPSRLSLGTRRLNASPPQTSRVPVLLRVPAGPKLSIRPTVACDFRPARLGLTTSESPLVLRVDVCRLNAQQSPGRSSSEYRPFFRVSVFSPGPPQSPARS